MQQAEFERAALTLQPEGPSGCLAPPQRLVDQKIVAIKAPQRFDLALGQVREQPLVKSASPFAAMRRPRRRADNVVLHVGRECRQNALNIVPAFERAML